MCSRFCYKNEMMIEPRFYCFSLHLVCKKMKKDGMMVYNYYQFSHCDILNVAHSVGLCYWIGCCSRCFVQKVLMGGMNCPMMVLQMDVCCYCHHYY